MVQEINENNFDTLINSEKPVLVDFWAQWCGPCRMLLPIIEGLPEKIGDKITIYKCNVDDSPAIAERFEIMSIPSLLIFKDGKLIARRTGGSSEQHLIDWINETIK